MKPTNNQIICCAICGATPPDGGLSMWWTAGPRVNHRNAQGRNIVIACHSDECGARAEDRVSDPQGVACDCPLSHAMSEDGFRRLLRTYDWQPDALAKLYSLRAA